MRRSLNALFALALLVGIIVPAVPARAASTNLIANPTVAATTAAGQPMNWTSNSWGANTASFSYVANAGHNDSTSLSIVMAARNDGDAKWIPDASAVTPGQNYTYSDWYQSNVATELDAQYTDGSGNVTYAYLTGAIASSSWAQASATFTIPTNIIKVSILHILATNGSLQTDDFSLTPTITTQPTGGNLIANPSFETANGSQPANWNTGSWGANNAQFSYATNTAHTGTKSANVSISSYTDGDAKWYADPVAVMPGQNYTYSDWYQSNVATHVVVTYIDTNGNYTYTSLADAAASSAAWAPYNATFTPPTGTTKVIIFHLLSSVGILTLDDESLIPTPQTSNMVPNSSVETADPNNPATPLNWQSNAWGTNTSILTYLTNGGHTGNHAVQVTMNKYTDGDAKWYFNPVSVTADTQYTFSDWYKSNVDTEVDVAFGMSDGTTVYQIIGLPGASSATWTNFSTTFSIPQGAQNMTVFHIIHSVGTLTLDDENVQPYTPIGFNRALVTLTFDDGYDNQYTQTLPLLKKYGFISTQFIITDVINANGYLTTAQVQALYKAGNEIASHTVTHNNMLTETPSQWITELSQSKSKLQQWTGNAVTDLAFPNGLYNQAILKNARQYYAASRGVEDGLNSKDNFNAYDIKVQNVYNTTTTAQVADWVKQAQTTKTWLVLVYHSIDPNLSNPVDSGIYNITPAQLEAQLSTIKTSGLPVLTMQQAIKELTPQLKS